MSRSGEGGNSELKTFLLPLKTNISPEECWVGRLFFPFESGPFPGHIRSFPGGDSCSTLNLFIIPSHLTLEKISDYSEANIEEPDFTMVSSNKFSLVCPYQPATVPVE